MSDRSLEVRSRVGMTPPAREPFATGDGKKRWAPPESGLTLQIDVDPRQPGYPWWMYRRPFPPVRHEGYGDAVARPQSSGAAADITGDGQATDEVRRSPARRVASPSAPAWAGGIALALTLVLGRLEMGRVGTFLIVVAALCFAVAFGRLVAASRPAEHWVGGMLLLGVLVKLAASWLRWWTIVDGYEGVADASMYDKWGREFATAWMTGGTPPELVDMTNTNFIRWFTGAVYYVFGIDMITGFIVFGLLAFIGSYLWYRATVDAIPFVDKRLYLALVLFVPSIAFWPSSIGKESLMQLGIGGVALGTSMLLRNSLVGGLAVGVAGGWLLWAVRPHLLAMVALAAGGAYILGRVRRSDSGPASLLSKPAGMIVVGFLLVFTVSEGANFLGLEELSLSSIQAELDEQTARSSQGGSEFDNGENSLNPINLPQGAVTVLVRPFPWETSSPLQLLASLEGSLLALALIWRLPSLKAALSRSRSHGFLLYCWILTALYVATFSSFANFGLLVRQRSLVLPSVLVLLAVDAIKAQEDPDDEGAPTDPKKKRRRTKRRSHAR